VRFVHYGRGREKEKKQEREKERESHDTYTIRLVLLSHVQNAFSSVMRRMRSLQSCAECACIALSHEDNVLSVLLRNSRVFLQKSRVFLQKSPVFLQKSRVFLQKSPVFILVSVTRTTRLYCPSSWTMTHMVFVMDHDTHGTCDMTLSHSRATSLSLSC